MKTMDDFTIRSCYRAAKEDIISFINPENVQYIENIVNCYADCVSEQIVLERIADNINESMDISFFIRYCNRQFLKEKIEVFAKEDPLYKDIWDILDRLLNHWDILGSEKCSELWLEFDCMQGKKEFPLPSIFYDAAYVNEKIESIADYLTEMHTINRILLDNNEAYKNDELLLDKILSYIIQKVGLYQIGIMLSRNDCVNIRIYTSIFEISELWQLMHDLGMKNNYQSVYEKCIQYEAKKIDLAINYNLETHQITDLIGVSIYYEEPDKHARMLYKNQSINPEQMDNYNKFNKIRVIRHSIHGLALLKQKAGHIKLTFSGVELLTVKTYFYYTHYIHNLHKAASE